MHPDAVCLCARFRGVRKGTDILDQEEIRSGSVRTILDRMYAFIERNNPTASVVRGRQRDNVRHYDPIVIHEALNNAIAYADYSVDGTRFHVHIFDDRLVIESPGPRGGGAGIWSCDEAVRSASRVGRSRVAGLPGGVITFDREIAHFDQARPVELARRWGCGP